MKIKIFNISRIDQLSKSNYKSSINENFILPLKDIDTYKLWSIACVM